MKNLLTVLTLASIFAFGACKKGEEDPGISFSSRNNRIEGTWNLTTGFITTITSNQNQVPGNPAKTISATTETYTITENGADFTLAKTRNGEKDGEDVKYAFPFALSITIDKDGTYANTFEGKIVGTGGNPEDITDKANGIWNWINSGKNKVGISFNSTIASLGDKYVAGDYNIKKLSGSEMILVRTNNATTTKTTATAITTTDVSSVIEFNFTKVE